MFGYETLSWVRRTFQSVLGCDYCERLEALNSLLAELRYDGLEKFVWVMEVL